MSESRTGKTLRMPWASFAVAAGLLQLTCFGLFLTGAAEGLYASVGGAEYRVREAMLMGGEASVGAATAIAAWCARRHPTMLGLTAVVRGFAGLYSLVLPFSDTWFFLLDPARGKVTTTLVFGLGAAQCVLVIVLALDARRPAAQTTAPQAR